MQQTMPHAKKDKSNLTNYALEALAGIYIISSQFYISESGGIQPAHLIVIFLLMVITAIGKLPATFGKSPLNPQNYIPFIAYSTIINLFWFSQQQDIELIASSIYYIFDFAVLIVFFYIFSEGPRKIIAASIDTALALALVIYYSGLGRYDFPPRYNGYFNDPNQMGLWLLCITGARILLLGKASPSIRMDLALVMSLILAFATESRSTIIGLFFVFSGYLTSRIASSSKLMKAIIIPLTLFTISLAVTKSENLAELYQNQSVAQRFDEINLEDDLYERGWYRLIDYPEYLIFGAGQGRHFRFNSEVEIHSTWAGILFYYGIIGFILFFYPVIQQIKALGASQKFVIIAPLAYSLTTFSARTPIFWLFIAAGMSAVWLKHKANFGNPKWSPFVRRR